MMFAKKEMSYKETKKANSFSSSRSRAIKRQERIAKTIIRFFAGITIVILIMIVGYILIRGFRYNNEVAYDVTPDVQMSIELPDNNEVIFIVRRNIRIKEISVEGLRKLYNKKRNQNWGFYNQQNLKVEPFSCSNGSSLTEEVKSFILAGTEETYWGKVVNPTKSWEDMIESVASTEGGLGYVPVSYKKNLPRSVKILGIRRNVLGVHPSVKKVANGKVLRGVTESEMKLILDGKLSNWKELGGPDLAIVLIQSPTVSQIKKTPGGVGIFLHKDVIDNELSFLPVTRKETGLNLTWHFLIEPPARSGQWGGISYIILNTLFLILFTLLFSVPVGVMAAVYLVEYTNHGRFVRLLRLGTDTLAAIPSIVFGLFGFIFFVHILKMGIGFISSTLTVTLMVLPTIIRTAEEALKSVPITLREGSLALGATKIQTIRKVVLPAASSGILAGIILAVGRTVGETAVLIYTLGSNYDLVSGPSSSARVLSLHLYMLFSEALSFDRTFATATVLVFIILITNFATTWVMKRMNRAQG